MQPPSLLTSSARPLQLPVNNGARRLAGAIPRAVIVLWFVFIAYLVLPLVDIPFLGLSLSAPVFFFIAVYALFKPPRRWFRRHQKWILLGVWFWSAAFVSVAANGLLSLGVEIESGGFVILLQDAYWMLVFVITSYLASQPGMLPRISRWIGWCVFALALVRLAEALIWGRYGAGGNPQILPQNTYGMQFSSFSPFLLYLWLSAKNKHKLWLTLCVGLFFVVVALNGSRSNWLATGIGLILTALLLVMARPGKFITTLLLIALAGAGLYFFLVSFPRYSTAVYTRASTFDRLEEDKSFEIRKLMNQKALRLFKSSPVVGVGTGRFRKEAVELDIPALLRGRGQAYYNRKSSHNAYLGHLAETGVMGALPYTALLLSLAFSGFKRALRLLRGKQYWALAVLVGFVQMSAHLWSMASLANTATWFVYGLVAAMTLYRLPEAAK